MTYSDTFIKRAREESQFCIYINGQKRFFFKQTLGEGEYIYSISDSSNDPLYYFNPDLKPKLVCIKVNDSLYILDLYGCGFGFDEELPEGVFDFNAALAELNRKVNDGILPQYLASLDLSEQMKNEKIVEYARSAATQTLLSVNPTVLPINVGVGSNFLTTFDVAQILCGARRLDNLALGRLRAKEEEWIEKAATKKKILEFMEQPGIVGDTQLQIAAALRLVDAKFVTVEFSFKGNDATGKMDPSVIYSNLKEEEDRFTKYDFATNVEGKKIFNALGAKDVSSKPEDRLTWRNITQIKYKGKTLYQA